MQPRTASQYSRRLTFQGVLGQPALAGREYEVSKQNIDILGPAGVAACTATMVSEAFTIP